MGSSSPILGGEHKNKLTPPAGFINMDLIELDWMRLHDEVNPGITLPVVGMNHRPQVELV